MPGVAASALSQPYPRHDYYTLRLPAKLTVFCDFDGPIINVSDRYYHTYCLALADVKAAYQAQDIHLPIHLLTKEQFWQMKQDRVPDLEIALRSGLQHEQIELFLQRVTHIVNQPALLHQDHLQPGVQWALALLHAQGARLILVTLRCQEQATQVLQSYGLLNLFSAIRGTQDCAAAYGNSVQQKTQLLADVLDEIGWCGLQSELAWMVGDTEADVLAGQAAGLPTIALTCGIRSQTYLERFAPTKIHRDLPTAVQYLVNSTVMSC